MLHGLEVDRYIKCIRQMPYMPMLRVFNPQQFMSADRHEWDICIIKDKQQGYVQCLSYTFYFL